MCHDRKSAVAAALIEAVHAEHLSTDIALVVRKIGSVGRRRTKNVVVESSFHFMRTANVPRRSEKLTRKSQPTALHAVLVRAHFHRQNRRRTATGEKPFSVGRSACVAYLRIGDGMPIFSAGIPGTDVIRVLRERKNPAPGIDHLNPLFRLQSQTVRIRQQVHPRVLES